jgi:CRP/FNR family transcriptional regulator, cyclic AMP receptor protein
MKKLSLEPDDLHVFSSALKKVSFFSGLSMQDLERVVGATNLYEYKSGKVIFRKGDVGDALFVVRSGNVKVKNRSYLLWAAKTIATLGPGDIFGEMALIDQPYRTATVVASGPTQLFVLLLSNFNQILIDNTAFAQELKKLAKVRAFEQKG